MKFFSVDGPLYKFLSKLWIALKLNFCWLLFSLPIITIGASTVAAYTIALKVVRDEEGHIFRPFAKAFAQNFKQGTIAWIINVIVAFAIYYDFQLAALEDMSELMTMLFFIFGIVCTFFMVLAMIYTYPLIARYENKLLATIKNSISIAFQFFVGTIVLVIILAVEICIFAWNTTMWFFGIILGPAVIILTISYYARNTFGIIELDPENIKEAKKKKRKNTEFVPEASGSEYTPIYDEDRILIMPDDDEEFEEENDDTAENSENEDETDNCGEQEISEDTETSDGEES